MNYNFRAPALSELARELNGAGLAWLEVDTEPIRALRNLRRVSDAPVASGENLMSLAAYFDLLSGDGADIVSIDVLWNGFLQSKKAADTAQLFGLPLSPHNFNGHLGTAISAHFAAVVPNLFLFEYDFDDVPGATSSSASSLKSSTECSPFQLARAGVWKSMKKSRESTPGQSCRSADGLRFTQMERKTNLCPSTTSADC